MTPAAQALNTGQTQGFMKAFVYGDLPHILGAAIPGAEGG
jgi:pyruvate/2-oxoglutarate dehydrogenase complex dihydrolipoamide dehydrogenase (E3) component